MNHFFKMLCLAGSVSLLSTQIEAQQTITTDVKKDRDIIIHKKSDRDTKVTIEIKGDEVKVNGKPLSEFEDSDIEVDLERNRPRVVTGRAAAPRSPFRGSTWSIDAPDVAGYGFNSNRALLGVTTEKGDNGVRVKSVSKASAAEKAGLKEGDVITKVDDTNIESPEDLTKAIGKYKPEDKVNVMFKRDKKDQKVTATLTKPSVTTVYSRNLDFNYENTPGTLFNNSNGLNFAIAGGAPRLGIKAQDTDDGKGVKVLEVDKGSNAEKSGLKEGDLITEFDGKAVNGATELIDAARGAKDKNSMKVKLLRDGKSQELEIKVPKKLKTANL